MAKYHAAAGYILYPIPRQHRQDPRLQRLLQQRPELQQPAGREWLRRQHGIDEYIESMRAWCRIRGREAAAAANRPIEYAEAFRQHLGHAYPRTNLLADVLADNAVLCEEKPEPDAG